MQYYKDIVENNNLDDIPDAITYYNGQLEEARKDLEIKGSVTKMASRMPGIIEYRYAQLQEIESICKHLEILRTKEFSSAFKSYTNSNRTMTSRDAEKYANGDDEVIELAILINSVSVVRDKFLGLTKGLESKHYQLTNLIKMKVAGFDDFEIFFN